MSRADWLRRVRPSRAPDLAEAAWHHFAVGFVGGVDDLAIRMLEAEHGEWPEVAVLAEAPTRATARRPDVVWLRIRSTATPRTTAVLRVLNLASHTSLRVAGWAPLDVVEEVPSDWLATVLAAHSQGGGDLADLRVLESLGGWVVADRLLSRVGADNLEERLRASAAFALGCATFNTPDGDLKDRVVREALALSQRGVSGVAIAARLLEHQRPAWELIARGAVESPGESVLATLAADPSGELSSAAVDLLSTLPGTRSAEVVDALLALAEQGFGDVADDTAARVIQAIAGLTAAPRTDRVVDLVERLFEEAARASVRQQAASTLVSLLGGKARDVWVRLLESRVVGDIDTGERLLATYGTAADLGIAMQAAQRLLRRKASTDVHDPPRGSDLLDFLSRFRGQVEVDALFFEVTARWPRLPEDLRSWLAANHPWTAPG